MLKIWPSLNVVFFPDVLRFTFMHLELSKSKKSKLVAKFGPKLMRSRVHLPEEIVNDGIHLDQDWLAVRGGVYFCCFPVDLPLPIALGRS